MASAASSSASIESSSCGSGIDAVCFISCRALDERAVLLVSQWATVFQNGLLVGKSEERGSVDLATGP